MRLEQTLRLAGPIGAVAVMMSLACSSASMKGGAGGGGGAGASGGSHAGAAGGGHSGGGGGTSGVADGGHPGGGGGASDAAGGGHPGGGGGTNADAGFDTQAGGNGGAVAGAGGGGTAGADAGLVASALTLPKCLSDLLSACPVATPCVSSSNDAGDISDVCFAPAADAGAGAHATITSMLSTGYPNGDCGNFTSVTVWKPDGSLCYTFERHDPIAYDCTVHTWTWMDARGFGVATGSSQEGPGGVRAQITCAPGGDDAASTSCRGYYPCCDVSSYGSARCPDGVNVLKCASGTCP